VYAARLLSSNSDSLRRPALKRSLETWNASNAVLGIIAVIAVLLSREFKHDVTNRA
jgi:hypothetical protein